MFTPPFLDTNTKNSRLLERAGFIHAVLFEIEPKEVRAYRKDCKMWAGYAGKAKGFIRYMTVKRLDHKNEFASVYEWKTKNFHDAFMKNTTTGWCLSLRPRLRSWDTIILRR